MDNDLKKGLCYTGLTAISMGAVFGGFRLIVDYKPYIAFLRVDIELENLIIGRTPLTESNLNYLHDDISDLYQYTSFSDRKLIQQQERLETISDFYSETQEEEFEAKIAMMEIQDSIRPIGEFQVNIKDKIGGTTWGLGSILAVVCLGLAVKNYYSAIENYFSKTKSS